MPALSSPAILAYRHGGPEVLELKTIDVPEPGPGEIRIIQEAIGLNYADIYQRQGAHGPNQTESFPVILGNQGAGIVESVGPGVGGFSVGQAVTYLMPGAYAKIRNVPASRSLPIPDGLNMEQAAGTLLRGMTAEYLLHRLYPVKPGDKILVHAAVGGMGLILSAWGRALGTEVIGTVGSDEKVAVAKEAGCHHVINYRKEKFEERVLELTGGEGVHVVYDAVGKDVFLPSLKCLRVRGMAINYGTASGDVEAFNLQILHAKSHIVTRPTLRSYVATEQELRHSAQTYAAAVRSGKVSAAVTRRYKLDEIQRAHRELESRATIGAAVIVP